MHLRIAAALVLAGCAAPAPGPRTVILESESYGCGAAEGLGCGLAIAPVLESIDAIEGVAESRASWDGRYFRIEVHPGADADRVAKAATERLEGQEVQCAVAAFGTAAERPNEWFDAAGTVELSRHEAGVIASDFSAEIAKEVTLEKDTAIRLESAMREELVHAFEKAHAAGGGVHRLWEQLPDAWPRFEARIAVFLTPEQSARVSAVVAREIEE